MCGLQPDSSPGLQCEGREVCITPLLGSCRLPFAVNIDLVSMAAATEKALAVRKELVVLSPELKLMKSEQVNTATSTMKCAFYRDSSFVVVEPCSEAGKITTGSSGVLHIWSVSPSVCAPSTHLAEDWVTNQALIRQALARAMSFGPLPNGKHCVYSIRPCKHCSVAFPLDPLPRHLQTMPDFTSTANEPQT